MDTIEMSEKEITRLEVIQRVKAKRTTQAVAERVLERVLEISAQVLRYAREFGE